MQRGGTMSKKTLYVAYDGPALASHEMDVRELAPALLALATLFEETNSILNKERAKITLNVKGSFKTGSFGFELSVVQDLFQSFLNFGSKTEIQSAATIATLLGFIVGGNLKQGLIQVIHWIRGRKIDKVEIKDSIVILYIGDEFLEIEEKVLQLLRNQKIRQAMEDAIKKPLEHDGIDSFGFAESCEKKISVISKEESKYYTAPKASPEDLGSAEYETTLQIIGVTFQDKNKWRFSDGISNTFYADMLDSNFLAKIDNHAILFGKGDIIRAQVRETKLIDITGTMRAERAIVHVFEHRNASVQLKLTD